MGLLVALGTKTVSTYTLPLPEPIEEFAEDNTRTVLYPDVSAHHQRPSRLCVATSTELQAVVTISYYDMLRQDTHAVEYTMAELRVQVSPLSEPFSSAYRETVFRLPLMTTTKTGHDYSPPTHRPRITIQPQAVFSADRRFLSCLVPFCDDDDDNKSAVVVFQLRRPRSDRLASITNFVAPQPQLPLPSYIPASTVSNDPIPVATNPKVLRYSPNESLFMQQQQQHDEPARGNQKLMLLQASCLCDATSVPELQQQAGLTSSEVESSSSLLLVGCVDGSILAVPYRPLSVLGTVHHQQQQSAAEGAKTTASSTSPWITGMDYMPNNTGGRLAVIDGTGNITVYDALIKQGLGDADDTTRVLPPLALLRKESSLASESMAMAISFCTTHHIPGSAIAAKWVGGVSSTSYLALMMRKESATMIAVQVVGLYQRGHSVPVSEIRFTRARVQDSRHTRFAAAATVSSSAFNGTESSMMTKMRGSCDDMTTCLDYDAMSDCLAIGSSLFGDNTDDEDSSDDESSDRREAIFVALWHWRSNTQGLTMARIFDEEDDSCGNHVGALLSSFAFSRDKHHALKLLHMVTTGSANASIRKDLYQLGIISPPECRCLQSTGLQRQLPLILSFDAVSYPKINKKSARSQYDIEWAEAPLPFQYLQSFGAPWIATIGRKWGRSVAIASENGLCTLDNIAEEAMAAGPAAAAGQSMLTRMHPKWYRFASDTEERSFRVVALTWWEGEETQETRYDMHYDDLVIAIVSIEAGKDRGYYLSSWSKKRLGVAHQLVADCVHTASATSWGVRLPLGFCPTQIDLLEQPACCIAARWSRKAIVLLSDDTHETGYHIYQLQVVSCHSISSESYPSQRPYRVLARRASHGSIGSRAHLFLGGASFAYDLNAESLMKQSDSFVATLGVIRLSDGGMDALALSSKDVTHVAQVIADSFSRDRDGSGAEVSAYWFSDIVGRSESRAHDDIDGYVWTIHLMSGKLLRWSVPCIVDGDGLDFLSSSVAPEQRKTGSSSVHPKSISLGLVCASGTAPQWMSRSASETGTGFPIGPLRTSSFACMVGTSQGCHKHYRYLGEDFESHMFRSDFLNHEIFCPSSFAIYPPTFLPPLFSFVVDAVLSDHSGDFINLYVKKKLADDSRFESSMMALQLLSLRMVEATATSKTNGANEKELPPAKEMFRAIVQAVMQNVTPLQFATLFLEVGRQLEPSTFPFLFPLAGKQGYGTQYESLEHLFDEMLEQGSISLAIAALPLFSDYDASLSICREIFRLCLARLGHAMEHDRENLKNLKEEREFLGDMFSYGIKLEDTGSLDLQPDMDGYYSDEEDDAGKNTDQRQSVFCGITRWFGSGRSKREEMEIVDAAASFIVDGFHEKQIHLDEFGTSNRKNRTYKESIASITAIYLVAAAFPKIRNSCCWADTAKLATVLVGDSSAKFRRASRSTVARMIENTEMFAFNKFLLAHEHGSGGYAKAFAEYILQFQAKVDATQAGQILDLILILLERGAQTSLSLSEAAGLLLIAFVAGHTTNRMTEIIPDDVASPLMSCYLDAKLELSNDRLADY